MDTYLVTPNNSITSTLTQLGGEHDPALHWRAERWKRFDSYPVPPETGKRRVVLLDITSQLRAKRSSEKNKLLVNSDIIVETITSMGWKASGVATLFGFMLEHPEVVSTMPLRNGEQPYIWACGSFVRLPRIIPLGHPKEGFKAYIKKSGQWCMLGCATGTTPLSVEARSSHIELEVMNRLFLAEKA